MTTAVATAVAGVELLSRLQGHVGSAFSGDGTKTK